MPVKTLNLNGKWKLKDANHLSANVRKFSGMQADVTDWLTTTVPGDIHPTLQKQGRIPDPFVDLNSNKCMWTGNRDWWYRRQIKMPKSFKGRNISLVFDGIDTYSTIYVNGKKIDQTSNMFRQYRFDVTDKILPGQINSIAICIHATKAVLEARDSSKYFACFYTPRVFARKAQCQFGWDWAPYLPSAGIWRSVRLEAVTPGVIEDIYIRTKINGNVHFQIKLDQATKALLKNNEKFILVIEINDGKKILKKRIEVCGSKNFTNIRIPNPKLWWPNGYGKPDLYSYKIKLLQGNKTLDEKTGRFGIREVEVIESPNSEEMHSFSFRVNGVDVFCMGVNWVPADCFPGTVTKDRYEHLIRLTHEANVNMLRIWGGGIYEDDVFYDLCDENGIMIWQDMMFACSDIPEDDTDFTMGLIPEFEYQVERLRNHPCITHWCGGNEKTGSFGDDIDTGKLVTHYLARGVIRDLCPDINYTPSSPISITDVSNDPTSGDTHGGTWEDAFKDDIKKFRFHIDKKQTAFMSEFGFHGPPKLSSVKKFISKEKLWPLSDSWEHHIMDNPYNCLKETYLQVQLASVCELFGKPGDAVEFIKYAGTFHAEYLYAEFLHHRRRQPANGGALIWMLNDCWPCASWSIIDYYGLPKQAYYAMKRVCQPVALSFRKVKGGFDLYLTHNLNKELNGTVTIQLETVDGSTTKKLQQKNVKIAPHSSEVIANISNRNLGRQKNSLLFTNFKYNGGSADEIYFHNLWKDVCWPQPGLKIRMGKLIKKNGEFETTIVLKTKNFARCVNISTAEDIKAYFSDNFFDMIPGQTKRITIRSTERFDPARLRLDHWLTIWD